MRFAKVGQRAFHEVLVTEFATAKDGVRIAWESAGEGAPIMLVHGFASDRIQNWRAPGWYKTLNEAGYRVIAMDCRGHGESDKPHDPSLYGHDKMAKDVAAVMQAAGISPAFLMGYSMGGFLSMHVLMSHAELVTKVIIAGVGGSYLDNVENSSDRLADASVRSRIADALIAPDKSTIVDQTALQFRNFAEQAGKDIHALAACMRADRRNFTAAELHAVKTPVLVVCGEKDNLTGSPDPLAAAFANGRAVTVPNRDHMTAVGDKVYKAAVLEFLKS